MMGKIKINMANGSAVEKPLVSAFKINEGTYVVFDNEMNGTMGLPIILVSKLVDNKLTVVGDAEWNACKETLRMIIAGNQVDYVNVNPEMPADDVFFKQLTLPVASFDVLKNSYKPVENPVTEEAMPNPFAANNFEVPAEEPVQEPVANFASTPEVNVETPVEPEVTEPVSFQNEPVEVAPVIPDIVAPNQEVANIMPEVTPEVPEVEPIPEVTESEPVDFTVDKEAFLKACENMFDALVAKIQK